MTLLSVENLTVAFPSRTGSTNAIEDVTLTVAPGEILGMVGESGAGKSMTGAAIIGLIEPPGRIAGGRILLEGQRIDNLSPDAMRRIRGRRIGAIFQDPLTSLNPVLTVGEQLVETIRTHLPLSRAEARERAIDWLRRVGIPAPEKRIDTYPHQYSGGMRQRVVIALALCAEPRLIIADEPTTALDVSVQAQIIALLRRLTRETGAAVILVTHDMGVIAETADRVAVMYAGRLVEVGAVAEVLESPRHPYTAGLMASIPRIGPRPDRLPQIEGAMPRPANRPAGCAFAPRCPRRIDRCATIRPELVTTGARATACHLTEEVPA
ncbi:MAG: ABC transporter ATP-binding protein [Paracoccaceae bacterium]|nr:MAG: ABC transporter ATP-binding protein [Paracoccaceae bacterium]